MKKQKFDFYREIQTRTSTDGSPFHGVFYRTDGSIYNYNFSKVDPDFSGLSKNIFFAIQEEPSGMENSYFKITVYDYENRDTRIEAYTICIKAYGDYSIITSALMEIRKALDSMQQDIFTGKLSIV